MIVHEISPDIKIRNPHDLFSENVEVVVVNDFDEKAVEKFKISFMKAEQSKQSVIPIYIDSYGGEVYSLLAMIDVLKSSNKKIATIVQGKAMSCGAVLFTMGNEGLRFMGANSTLMIHDVSSYAHGKNDELKVSAEEADRLNTKIYQIMSRNIGKSDEYLKSIVHDKSHANWYLTPEECVKHNIANHIRIPRLKVSAEVKIELI